MRVFTVELKRLLKTRSVQIMIVICLLLAGVLAYFPVSFEGYAYVDDSGNEVRLKGWDAVRAQKENQGQFHGEITPDKLAAAVEKWNEFAGRYEGGLPDGIYDDRVSATDYYESVYPYEFLLTRMKEAYADPSTGFSLPMEELTKEKAEGFYEQVDQHLKDLIYLENGEGEAVDAAVSQAMALYGEKDEPFYYEAGIGSNAIEYTGLLVFLLVIVATVMMAPVFSNDYQTQAEQILKCTRHGRRKLAVTRILAGMLILTVVYFVSTAIFILFMNTRFGWESLQTSIQLLLSVAVILPVNVWELQLLIIFGGYLSLLATVCFTLFLSGRMKSIFASSVLALVFLFLPLLLYMIFNSNVGEWLRSILPSSGVGLNNSLTYALLDTKFAFAGGTAIWVPYLMTASAAVETVVFFILTVADWCKKSKG